MKTAEDIVKAINAISGEKIAKWGDDETIDKVEFLSSGMLPLDLAIGGGLPKGRILEVKGLFSTGKSSLCLNIIKNLQKQDIQCIYIDAEYTLDVDFATQLGVDLEKLVVIQPNCGEDAFAAIDKIVRGDKPSFIVVDSVSGLVPRGDIEAEPGKYMIGSQAKLMSMEIRKILKPLSKSGSILVFINQLRMNIAVGSYTPYTTPGGMALRFYTSVSIEIRRNGVLKKGDEITGYTAKLKITKNKVGKPNGECEVTFMNEGGFSTESDVITLGEQTGIITKEANSYFYKGEKIGGSLNKARDYFKSNPNLAQEILSLALPKQNQA